MRRRGQLLFGLTAALYAYFSAWVLLSVSLQIACAWQRASNWPDSASRLPTCRQRALLHT